MWKRGKSGVLPRLKRGFIGFIVAALTFALCVPATGFAASAEQPAVQQQGLEEQTAQETTDGGAADLTPSRKAGDTAEPAASARVVLKLTEGSVYLRESNGVKQYSRDMSSWQDYEGSIVVSAVASAGTFVSVSGDHDIILRNATIQDPGDDRAAIQFEDGSSKLTLVESSQLTGGEYYPAIEVMSKASLVIAGSGRLDATGGSDAPAIGCNSLNGSLGELTFEHTGTINATSEGSAPALGDSASDAGSLSGKVIFKSGTVNLSSPLFTTDIGASRIEAWGGNVLLSKSQPKVYTRGYLSHPFGSSGGEATYLRISGLPQGFNWVNARLYYKNKWAGNVFGLDATYSKIDYGVAGFSPVKKEQDIGIFLFSSYYGFTDQMYFALMEDSGAKYEGHLRYDGATGGYRASTGGAQAGAGQSRRRRGDRRRVEERPGRAAEQPEGVQRRQRRELATLQRGAHAHGVHGRAVPVFQRARARDRREP